MHFGEIDSMWVLMSIAFLSFGTWALASLYLMFHMGTDRPDKDRLLQFIFDDPNLGDVSKPVENRKVVELKGKRAAPNVKVAGG